MNWPARTPATTAWPSRRGNPVTIARRFGQPVTDKLRSGLRTGDPLADAVVVELAGLGEPGKKMLDTGIRRGLSALSAPPPAIAAFLDHAESIPGWVSTRELREGPRTFLSANPAAHALNLSLRSLTHTYRSPSIARVLTGIYDLIARTKGRLLETTDWLVRSMMPGGLVRGGDGYVATLQVRLLHAQSRALAVRAASGS